MAAAKITREGDSWHAAKQAATAETTNQRDLRCAAASKLGATAGEITGEGGPDAAAGPY
jgi:hypothetical protein